MSLDQKTIAAMAVAAIAEQNGIAPKRVKIIAFSEVQKSSLEKYIEDNGIEYTKYKLNV
ncbi:MAG: hypothetical protein K6G90_13215 [Clostridia bacterium]|nr:hypothetical protein [Clostridia bacterium]